MSKINETAPLSKSTNKVASKRAQAPANPFAYRRPKATHRNFCWCPGRLELKP